MLWPNYATQMSDIQLYPSQAIPRVIPEEVMTLPSLIILALHLTSLCIARTCYLTISNLHQVTAKIWRFLQSRATPASHTEYQNVKSVYENA